MPQLSHPPRVLVIFDVLFWCSIWHCNQSTFYTILECFLVFHRGISTYGAFIGYCDKHNASQHRAKGHCEDTFVKCCKSWAVTQKPLTLFLASPLKANLLSGFPAGTLYLVNHSTVAYEGGGREGRGSEPLLLVCSTHSTHFQKSRHHCLNVSHICRGGVKERVEIIILSPLSFSASGSVTSMANTFQSVSPVHTQCNIR